MGVKVWVAYANDHDYDVMGQWLVGVYSSLELANEAVVRDMKTYTKNGGDKNRYNCDIHETEIDIDYDNG